MLAVKYPAQQGFHFCKRRSNNPSLKRPDIPVAPERKSGSG
jgi:hypothetical protein